MNGGKLDLFTSGTVRFLSEQIGVPENEFKEEVVALFKDTSLVSVIAVREFGISLSECHTLDVLATGERRTLMSVAAAMVDRPSNAVHPGLVAGTAIAVPPYRYGQGRQAEGHHRYPDGIASWADRRGRPEELRCQLRCRSYPALAS